MCLNQLTEEETVIRVGQLVSGNNYSNYSIVIC